jgi:hypothetical protein
MRALLLLITGMLLVSSCKKDSSPEPVPCFPYSAPTARIAEATLYTGPDTAFYQRNVYIYDSTPQQRLVFVVGTILNLTTDTFVRYKYLPGEVHMNDVVIHLNAQGLADSMYVMPAVRTWKYDAAGYPVTSFYTFGGETIESVFHYECNNLVSLISTSHMSSGSHTDTTRYTYYNDRLNTIGTENLGMSFYGHQDNTLVKTGTRNGVIVVSCSYVFDTSGRVTWKTMKGEGTTVSYMKYTYR